jgi:hypothetical protein
MKRALVSVAVATAACASWVPESELPVAKDLDCSERIKLQHDDVHTLATGCGRTKSYRCKVDAITGERSCKVRGDEAYGVESDTWVNGVQ